MVDFFAPSFGRAPPKADFGVVGGCGRATPDAGTFGCDFLLGEGPFFSVASASRGWGSSSSS